MRPYGGTVVSYSLILIKKKFNIENLCNCVIYTYLPHGAESSWKANWFAASQEIPRISRNPKVHYRTHKRPPPVPILGQPNPVHIHTVLHI